MNIDSNHLISITRLQKELTQKVRDLTDSGEPLYILKNSDMEAVMVPFRYYEYLRELEEMFEYFEIDSILKERLSGYDPGSNIPWERAREEG